MMKLLKEDVTTATDCIIPQGVNCKGRMASGVAKYIKEKWPVVYNDFMSKPTGKGMLGFTSFIEVEPDVTVVNCYTQEFFGRDGKRYADLDAVSMSLTDVFTKAGQLSKKVCMPKIGCGLGGLDWESEVKPIVVNLSEKFDVNVYVYEI